MAVTLYRIHRLGKLRLRHGAANDLLALSSPPLLIPEQNLDEAREEVFHSGMEQLSAPKSVVKARVAVAVVAGIHLVALVLILTHRDAIAASVLAAHPDWTPGHLSKVVAGDVTQSVVPHLVLPAILLARAARLRSGQPRTRLWLSVILGIQVIAHATLPIILAELPGYALAVVTVQAVSLVAEITALVLLWKPESSRAWFVGQAVPQGRLEAAVSS